MYMRKMGTALAVCTLLTCAAAAEDWPQWRGPNRGGVSKETGLLKAWPADGPQRLWVFRDAGVGYAGFAVVGDTLYTMGERGEVEHLIAVNVADGSEKWATKMGGHFTYRNWGDGPRGTPTVDGEHVYALGANGGLVCAKASDGKIVWRTTMSKFGGETPKWGYAESVLVDGDQLVCTPGGRQGAILALNKKTGAPIWQSKEFTEPAEYSSIIIAEHNGARQYIQLTMKKAAGVDARSGRVLWTHDWPGRTAVIPTPIFHDGHVFLTSGYGVGCELIEIGRGNNVRSIYKNKDLDDHHGGVVLVDGHVYGHGNTGGWICQAFKTGEIKWSEKRTLGKGCVTYADGRLYCLSERDGTVALIEASPQGWNEHGRFRLDPQTRQRAPSGAIWSHPTVANGRLYLRDQELLSCYDIKAK